MNPAGDVPEIPHRRRRVGLWKSIPLWVKATVLLCLLVVALIPVIWDKLPRRTAPVAANPASAAVARPDPALDEVLAEARADLALTESAMNQKTRRIEGIVSNSSDRLYTDVVVSFYLADHKLNNTSPVSAVVSKLGPHESARFATEPIAVEFKQWIVKRISGTRH
jgi:hypothetical protein